MGQTPVATGAREVRYSRMMIFHTGGFNLRALDMYRIINATTLVSHSEPSEMNHMLDVASNEKRHHT